MILYENPEKLKTIKSVDFYESLVHYEFKNVSLFMINFVLSLSGAVSV